MPVICNLDMILAHGAMAMRMLLFHPASVWRQLTVKLSFWQTVDQGVPLLLTMNEAVTRF